MRFFLFCLEVEDWLLSRREMSGKEPRWPRPVRKDDREGKIAWMITERSSTGGNLRGTGSISMGRIENRVGLAHEV